MLEVISPELPCGNDFKYDDDYLAIEQEIDKANSLSGDVSVDWDFVQQSCERITREESKDLKILSWWLIAAWHKRTIEGVVDALVTITTILETYKSGLFPKSPRGKLSVVAALETFVSEKFLDGSVNLEHMTKLETLHSTLVTFSSVVQEAFETEESYFNKLILQCDKAMKAVVQKQQQKAKEAEKESSGIHNDSQANAQINTVRKAIEPLQAYWEGHQPTDMRLLKMNRMLAWLDIDTLPMAENGKTFIQPPNEHSMEQIEALEAEGKVQEALVLCESLIVTLPFWLDGHVKSFELLTLLEAHNEATYVLQSLMAFSQTFKGILELQYADGSAFATMATKELLQQHLPSGNADNATQEMNGLQAVQREALALIKKKQYAEAMQSIESYYFSSKTEKERFESRLLHAELAIQIGKMEVAQALLEDLRLMITTYKLDQWNPTLAAKAYSLYLQHFDRTHVEYEHLSDMYNQLCKIDIAQALQIAI